ncbi:MAG: acetyl-CoA carboxylase biotin carboxyl carrier protein subunit [Candidatus Thermofonsia bacterium]|nr:MAG: acetyl-CoA carboxylase biotin carboxyl carrier protein subunit [Candidatus Thermofonsia bacterium]
MRYKYYASVEGKSFEIEIGDGALFVNGEQYELDFRELPEGNLVSLLINNRSLEAAVDFEDDLATVLLKGELYEVTVQDERAYRLAQARGTVKEVTGNVELKSPMPGIIIAVPVSEGDVVKKGDKVVILESMKMENELRASKDGVILAINTAAGDSVEKGQVLAVIGDATGE